MKTIAQYCQKCRAANAVGDRSCRLCGTRLMLVVFPPSIRHDDAIVPSYYEDHLLERVSLLELQLAQALQKIGLAFEFLARESKELKKDRGFTRAFAESIRETNPQLYEEIKRNQDELPDEPLAESEVEEGGAEIQILQDILSRHDKPNAELFTHILREGVRLLNEREEKQAFQMLERAALLSPENVSLLIYVGENLYRADKFEKSRAYLEKAFELAPLNEKTLLLLGAICADAGETEQARKFLSVPANVEKTSMLVHLIWGMMAAFEENWTESLAAFKQTLGAAEVAESNYLIGCVYFQMEGYDSALKFLEKAISIDAKFSDARFLQNLIRKIQTGAPREKAAIEIAADKRGAENIVDFDGKNLPLLKTAPPFLHFKQAKSRLLSSGAPRLAKFFRERIFKAIE